MTNSFDISPTPLGGLMLVTRRQPADARGFFSRLFCAREMAEIGWRTPVAQINHSLTRQRGAVRGLHFQHPPHAEDKYVSCLRGAVFDVAVDLRAGSPTFLRWHGETLSAANGRSLLIPQGFAHGFQALERDCEMIYLHSQPYAREAEGGLRINDPRLAIAWPDPVTELSERDAGHALLADDFPGLRCGS
jgi:dTDP-4-dehydrorhamnose 3,5-epimerase